MYGVHYDTVSGRLFGFGWIRPSLTIQIQFRHLLLTLTKIYFIYLTHVSYICLNVVVVRTRMFLFSGVAGSGVCILSKHPIKEAFFHQWSLNGYMHKIHHGDWFGGKGVGLCKIAFDQFTVNVYSAHVSFNITFFGIILQLQPLNF